LRTGRRRRIRKVQHTGCQVGVEHLAALASFEARLHPPKRTALTDRCRSSHGATRSTASFRPPESDLTDPNLCLLPRGERVLCVRRARIPGPDASFTEALASQRTDSTTLRLTPSSNSLPDRDCKQPRSAATGLCAAATLTSQCLRLNTPKGALTADAPHQPREADSTLRTTLQHPERRRNGYDSRTADPLASGRRQRLLLRIRHRDCSCSLLPASNSSCFTAPRTARFSGCLPCREAEQTALPSLARRKHLGGGHAALRSKPTSAGPLRGRRTRKWPTRSHSAQPTRPVTRTNQQFLTA
jgi:hypothetical protein